MARFETLSGDRGHERVDEREEGSTVAVVEVFERGFYGLGACSGQPSAHRSASPSQCDRQRPAIPPGLSFGESELDEAIDESHRSRVSESGGACHLLRGLSGEELFERHQRCRRRSAHAGLVLERDANAIGDRKCERSEDVHQPRVA